ncbi:MAG TPA: HlyD family efflux transporter periplasmic adaptor subunit [Vicinamibacteria bacterium]
MSAASLAAFVRRRPAVLAGIGVAALAAAGMRLARTAPPDGVATIEVKRGPFVRDVSATGTLRAVRATPIVAPPESGRQQKIALLARDGAVLHKGDLVVEFDPYEAEREAADGQADLAAAAAKIRKSQAEAGKTAGTLRLDREVAADALDRAEKFQITDAELFSRNEIIESRLDKDLFARKADVAGRKIGTSARLSAADERLGEIEADKARFKLANAAKSLRSLRILAPHDGLLVLEKNWRGETAFVGDSVWPGQKLAEIPDLSELEARVFVLEADAAGLKQGLPARLSIEGRPGTELSATVSRVDALAKPRDQMSPVKYFETTLALEKTDASFMKPGQRVRAAIRLEEAADLITVPRGALFDRDGKRVVYRWERGAFVPVEVTVSRNSVSRVVVDTGLQPGDRIALRDPSRKEAVAPGSAPAGPPGTTRP